MKQPTGRRISVAQIPEHTYIENGYSTIPSVRLGDKEYGQALQRFIAVCTDVVPINSERRVIYLAWRKQKPMVGWWWIGGGMLPGEMPTDAAVRNFRRETKLEIAPERLVYRANFIYLFKDRQQQPQNIGCHSEGRTFTLEVAPEEVGRVYLDEAEYGGKELIPFDRDGLLSAQVFPAVLDLYNIVFPMDA